MRRLIDNTRNIKENLVPIYPTPTKNTPIRQAMLDQFGYVSKDLLDKVKLDKQ